MDVIVIGGGYAGLSAATALVEQGAHVTLLEGRQVLGGRAYSFVDPVTGDVVDNGQHLFMGCYAETLRFLSRIGTLDRLEFQPRLRVDFIGANGHSASLATLPLPAPLHLWSGLLRLGSLPWIDRWRLRQVWQAVHNGSTSEELDQITVEEWLCSLHQGPAARHRLWDLIAIAALNEDPTIASAGPFVEVLKRALFDSPAASRLGFARVGLSQLFADPALEYLRRQGAELHLGAAVARLGTRDTAVTSVELRDGGSLTADRVVAAVPPAALLKMLPDAIRQEPFFRRFEQLKTAPIISINLWLDRDLTDHPLVGLWGTHVQWLFNKSRLFAFPKSEKGYISLVISGAHQFIHWTKEDLLRLALQELGRLFPAMRRAGVRHALVLKEQQATLSPATGTRALRPSFATPLANLFLAGDWTDTGLPATIESACVSGHRVADLISSHG